MKISKEKIKTLSGALLALLSICALVFWESAGRELILMDKAIAAKVDIESGTLISTDMLKIVSVPADALPKNIPGEETADLLSSGGLRAARNIGGGEIITDSALAPREPSPHKDKALYVLPREWIAMCSGSLRGGDDITIRAYAETRVFGSFKAAYVKDSDGRDVMNRDAGIGARVDRPDASAPVDHVEILCTWNDFSAIRQYCESKTAPPLALIREEKL